MTAEDARRYIAIFRRVTMPGTEYVDTQRRRIWLDRMSDDDALFVAAEFRRMEIAAAELGEPRRGNRRVQ